MTTKNVLLINLGTPDQPNPFSVYRYLTEFLNDPRVVDLPTIFRWPLVNLFIVPCRYRQSSKAYQSIWDNGSPLLKHSLQLKDALADKLGDAYQVALGMRYGNPSIAHALSQLPENRELIIMPLFPHYSSAATGSALIAAIHEIGNKWNIPTFSIKKDFYHHPQFIHAYATLMQEALSNKSVDFVLFSYHGLPERHIQKSQCKALCDKIANCPPINEHNWYCYRAQCYATSRLLANALQLNRYQVSFQSRLGRTPWIKPYTDILLTQLIEQGIQSLAVVSPSFVTDCLETLEEIDIRLRKQWLSLGGKEFVFIPALNTHPTWVNALHEMIKEKN